MGIWKKKKASGLELHAGCLARVKADDIFKARLRLTGTEGEM